MTTGGSTTIIMGIIILVVFALGFCILTEVDDCLETSGSDSRGGKRRDRQRQGQERLGQEREYVDTTRHVSDREVEVPQYQQESGTLSRAAVSRFLGSSRMSPPATPPDHVFHQQLEQALNIESVESAEQLLTSG